MIVFLTCRFVVLLTCWAVLGSSLTLACIALGGLFAEVVAWSALCVRFAEGYGKEDPPRWDVFLDDGVAALGSLV